MLCGELHKLSIHKPCQPCEQSLIIKFPVTYILVDGNSISYHKMGIPIMGDNDPQAGRITMSSYHIQSIIYSISCRGLKTLIVLMMHRSELFMNLLIKQGFNHCHCAYQNSSNHL